MRLLRRWLLLTQALGILTALGTLAGGDPLAECNVVWTTPSTNSSGSMPLGKGDLGVNLWVEEGGDLLFYVSKTDAWDAHSRLLKLGRIRVKLAPHPFHAGLPFRQELRLREGDILITAGQPDQALEIRVWVDALQPVVRLELEGRRPFWLEADLGFRLRAIAMVADTIAASPSSA